MRQIEEKLDELLVKKAPFQIPEEGRKGIVKALPWVALIGGVLMLLAAWYLYRAVTALSHLADWLGAYGANVGPGPLVWVALALLVVEAVMMFMAFTGLQANKKAGWNLLFYAAVLHVAQAVVQAIGYTDIGHLIMSLIGALAGLYILFQVRSHYMGAVNSSTTMKMPKETPPSTPTAKV